MKVALVTLFPEAFDSFLATGLLAKALEAQRLQVERVDPRAFTRDRHRTVDDAPYGGGAGMVMKPEPLVAAIESAEARLGGTAHKVLLTPQGCPFVQATARRFASLPRLVLVCGRYEGVDERVRRFVASGFFFQLMKETFFLIDRVIQLGESVGQLTADNKQLKPINNVWILIILTRQW